MRNNREDRYQAKPTVAHFVELCLALNGPFLYTIFSGLRRYRSVVCANRVTNLDVYPGLEIFRTLPSNRYLRFAYRLCRKLVPDAYTLARYGDFICKEKVRIIHAHTGPDGYRALPVSQRFSLPLIVSFIGHDASALLRQKQWVLRYRKLFEQASCIVVVSKFLRDQLVSVGCRPQKIEIVHLGIDIHSFSFVVRPPNPPAVRFLSVGRFVEKKAPLTTIRAFAALHRCHPDTELRMVGSGPMWDDACDLVVQLGLEDSVHLVGKIPNCQVRGEMERAHLLVHPCVTASDGDTEGQPVVLVEAQATGLPVIATKHNGIPEVVIEGTSGLLVPEGDEQKLVEAMTYLFRNRALWEKFGRTGRRHVEKNFNAEIELQKLEKIYDRYV